MERLQRMVADLTGFPSDMLEPDLDLEADLGIDSIKRVEILVEAQDRFPGFADTLDDEGTTAFSRLTTLARMAEFLESATSGTGGGDSEDARAARDVVARRNLLPERDGADPVRDERAPARRAPRLVPAAASRRRGLGAGNVVVAGDCRGVAQALARKLPELVPLVLDGGRVGSNAAGTRLRELDSAAGYIHLGMLSAGPSTLEQLRKRSELARRDLLGFAANLKAMAALLRSSGGFVIVAAPFGPSSGGGDGAPDIDPLAGGHLGLLKSVAREWPEVRCRAVDLGAYVDVDAAVGILVNEMGCDDGAVEVAYRDGRRHAVVLSDSHPVAGPSAGPLREGDVVLATGGARGITGEVAVAIAERWRPRLVLVGSTVLEDENPRYGGFSDMAGLKREIGTVLDESGETLNAARVEREYRTVVRRREIRRNLRRLRDAGAEAEYVVADVGDRAAFGRVLADVRQRYGRIDAVVHGAGIREDKLLVDKDMESFDRVLRPKVDGALALLERLDLDSLKLLFFFSSTAASYGSAGQSDYAAANETLNALARWLGGRTPARVVSIGWGPWRRASAWWTRAWRAASSGVESPRFPCGRASRRSSTSLQRARRETRRWSMNDELSDAAVAPDRAPTVGGPREDIAIVGMSCLFAKADGLASYWSNVLDKVDAVGDVPPGRWDARPHLEADPADAGRIRSARGAFLADTFRFDPVKLRVPPSAIRGADPDQFLVLRCVREALADAGCADCPDGQRTEVVIGRTASGGAGSAAFAHRTEGARRASDILAAFDPGATAEELARAG